MSQDVMTNKKFEEERSKAVGFGMLVYTGGVVTATAIFIFFILTAFPQSAYFIRFLMILGALCVGVSALAFRYALEGWAVSGNHRKAAIGFYYGEIFLVGLNTIVSFSSLLYTFAGNPLPEWVAWYEPFTIATIAYVILAWGTLFVLDPRSKSKARQIEVLQDFDNQVVEGMRAYIKSEDGLQQIQANANKRIADNFSVQDSRPKRWIQNGASFAPWICPHCSIENSGSAGFCGSCGAPKGAAQAPASPPSRPALPLQSTGPGLLPPRNAPRSSYTLDSLLASMGVSPDQARDMVRTYGLWDAMTAFTAMDRSGYLPAGITQSDFMPLFCELFGVAPTWGSIAGLSYPNMPPAAPGNNGASNKSF